MNRTFKQLVDECNKRNIKIPEKNTKQTLIKLLGNKSLQEMSYVPWGLRARLRIDNPMLCFPYKRLNKFERYNLWESKDWALEEKFDGVRVIITYNPHEGFMFFSRNVSVNTFLPTDYTNNILLYNDNTGKFTTPDFWAYRLGEHSFVLDSEMMITDNINTEEFTYRGGKTGTGLNACTSILTLDSKSAHEIQRTQAHVYFNVFDCLEYDDCLIWTKSFKERIGYLNGVCKNLKYLQFKQSKVVYINKREFYNTVIKNGGEGVIFKRLDSPYYPTSTRRRDGFVKLKRSVKEAYGKDIDVFVSGYVEATKGKAWDGLIGGLKLSIILGGGYHWIATVTTMPLEIRKRISEIKDGKPVLKKQYYNKVITIDGQDLSPKSLRFMHAVADWDVGFREDKNWYDCTMELDFLKSQVL